MTVDKRAALYQQFDPTRPLEADEEDLYVDWQRELGFEDVKQRLANSIAFSGPSRSAACLRDTVAWARPPS